jgi:hypothetical protein
MLQIKNNIEELKYSTNKTSLLFCDNPAVYSLMQQFIIKLEQIEKLIDLDSNENLTEVATAVRQIYEFDTNVTHIVVKLQVRPVEVEVKECLINGKLYL